MAYVGANTNYKILTNTDIGARLVTVEYLLDTYPSLANSFKTAGLWVWGSNTYGQLGTNNLTQYSSPVQTVAGGTNWKQVDGSRRASGSRSFAGVVKTGGTLWLWGDNTNGNLGDNTTTHRSSPVQTIAGGTNWKQVSCGGVFAGGIKTDGTLWMWGSNGGRGYLGSGDTTNYSSPVQTVSAGTNWKQISCGGLFTAAVKTDGTLWTWGYGSRGELGNNASGVGNFTSSPIQTVSGGTNWKQVSCGSIHAAAIKTDGTLWLWGDNTNGGLGDNTRTHRSSPVQTVSGGTNWKQVSAGGGGNNSFTAAIKTDGTLWTWGDNGYGALGNNTSGPSNPCSSPVQTVSGGTNWKQVASGTYNCAAIKTDGSLWLWGYAVGGGLGDGTQTSKSSPVQTISSGGNWRQVSFVSDTSTFAIRDDSEDPF